MTVFDRISQMHSELSASQRKLAAFIMDHAKEAAFMTSIELADATGVSNPTVIRFISALGYEGYREFQFALQNAVQNELSSLERLSYLKLDAGKAPTLNMFLLETDNLNTVYNHLDHEVVKGAIDLLSSSATTFVFGQQISEAPAMFAFYTLSKILDDVRLVSSWGLWDEVAYRANPERCCALVIAMPRYPVATIEFLRLMQQHHIPTIVITGEASAFPLPEAAKYMLCAPVKYISFIDPIASVFCLINSLAIGLINRNGQVATKAMLAFEKYVTDCRVYLPGSVMPDSASLSAEVTDKRKKRNGKEKT